MEDKSTLTIRLCCVLVMISSAICAFNIDSREPYKDCGKVIRKYEETYRDTRLLSSDEQKQRRFLIVDFEINGLEEFEVTNSCYLGTREGSEICFDKVRINKMKELIHALCFLFFFISMLVLHVSDKNNN